MSRARSGALRVGPPCQTGQDRFCSFVPFLVHFECLLGKLKIPAAQNTAPRILPEIAAKQRCIRRQGLSGGRFALGLGTQVKPHVERRYGATWDRPVERMQELVEAVRAVFACWQNGERLDFRGDHYELTLMTPVFDPGPLEVPGLVGEVHGAPGEGDGQVRVEVEAAVLGGQHQREEDVGRTLEGEAAVEPGLDHGRRLGPYLVERSGQLGVEQHSRQVRATMVLRG